MDSSIRLLGIVPYEGMKTLLLRLAEEYPQLAKDIHVTLPDENMRRVGQSIAAASLPLI